jgi:hypothetical protein
LATRSGEGGAVLTNDPEFAAMGYNFHYQGRGRPVSGANFTYSGTRGSNLRLSEFQASLLGAQMTRVIAQTHRRTENAKYLTQLLNEIPGITPAKLYDGVTRSAYHLYMFHYDPATGVFTAELGQISGDEGVSAPADDEYHSAPRTIDMWVQEPKRSDNVETAARKTLQSAHQYAAHLAQVAGDARALGELERLLPILANEADLLDSEQMKSQAARALELLARLKDAHSRDDAVELEQLLAPAKAAETPPPTAPLPSTQAAADSELREIFVEEAREVLDSIVENLAALRTRRDDQATMTTVRRAFHTLKGSSRMVGFKTVGEAAWGVEQCFNLWLAQERPANDDLL